MGERQEGALDAAQEAEEAAAEAEILKFLKDLGVEVSLHRHPPLFTVEDSQALRGDLPGAHVKNMFMKDKKGGLWLATCLEDRRIRIKDLEKAVGAPKMSFGKPELLWEVLGVRPGAVTPLGLMNDRAERRVRVLLDATLMTGFELLNCHPLHNRATVTMPAAGLARFVEACGHTPELVDFDALERAAAEAS